MLAQLEKVKRKLTSEGNRPSSPQPPTQASVPGGGEELARPIGCVGEKICLTFESEDEKKKTTIQTKLQHSKLVEIKVFSYSTFDDD